MSTEFRLNIAATTSQWLGIWSLTRVMKKAGWRHQASSDGTTKVVSSDPLADKWLGTQTTLNSGSAASITAIQAHPYGNLMTVTGLSGLVSPTTAPLAGKSEGNYLTISGSSTSANNGNHQIYAVLSSTSCQVLNTSASTPAVDNSGALTWSEKDASSEVYGTGTTVTDSSAGWIVLEGPLTLQLSFTSAITGTFIRGEPITQSSSGATGECIGTVYDSSLGQGWMIVQPRTGTFDATDVLTGGWSGATVTPSTLYTFRRQVVFYKTSGSTRVGAIWYQCVRMDTESADLFSTLASNAACTATVPPGGSTTSGNRFPANTNSYVMRATNNSTNDGVTALSVTDGFYDKTVEGRNSGSGTYCNGRINVCAVNAMPKSGVSADGTWWIFHCNTNCNMPTNVVGAGTYLGFNRIDTIDPGEAELYWTYSNQREVGSRNQAYSDHCNTNNSYTSSFSFVNFYWQGDSTQFSGNNSAIYLYQWKGLYARSAGSSLSTSWTNGSVGSLGAPTANNATTAGFLFATSTSYRQENHPNATRPLQREHPVTRSGRGGRLRWVFLAAAGNNLDTLDSKSWFCVAPFLGSNSTPGVWIGPLDGSTTLLMT